MPRIEIELTSARPDGTWTWRAAGARQPKGMLDGTVLPGGAKVGDVLRAEADIDIDGITVRSTSQVIQKKVAPERIEIVGSGREEPSVTTNMRGGVEAGGERGRRGDRDQDRARDRPGRPGGRPGGPGGAGGPSRPGGGRSDQARPRTDGGLPTPDRGERARRESRSGDAGRPARDRPGADRPAGARPPGDRFSGDPPAGDRPAGDRPAGERDRGGGGGRPSGDRPGGRPSGDRPSGDRQHTERGDRPARGAPRPAEPARPRARRLQPGRTYRDAVLAELSPDRKAVAEQILRGGIPAVRQAVEEQNAKAREVGGPEIKADALLAVAEELLPALKAAEWRDRADAAIGIVDEISVRDLRAVVSGAETARDEEGRALASTLREALDRRAASDRQSWVDEITSSLDEGRVVRALRISGRPPEPGVRFPAELAKRLSDASGEALGPDTTPDRWAAVLEAVVASPVRRTITPRGLPPEPGEELTRALRLAAPRVPAIGVLLGDPPGAPPRPPRPAGARGAPPSSRPGRPPGRPPTPPGRPGTPPVPPRPAATGSAPSTPAAAPASSESPAASPEAESPTPPTDSPEQVAAAPEDSQEQIAAAAEDLSEPVGAGPEDRPEQVAAAPEADPASPTSEADSASPTSEADADSRTPDAAWALNAEAETTGETTTDPAAHTSDAAPDARFAGMAAPVPPGAEVAAGRAEPQYGADPSGVTTERRETGVDDGAGTPAGAV